jgi:hypothetical protein
MKWGAKNPKPLRLIMLVLTTLWIATAHPIVRAGDFLVVIVEQPHFYNTDTIAVPDTWLDKIRGGFDSGNGVMISFGIERATYINGVLKTSTSFNLPPNLLSAGAVIKGRVAAENFTVIQNGAGNTDKAHTAPGELQGTFIQNSLDNQAIRATTTINAITNTSQVMKSLNFGSTLRDALGAAVVGR